MSKVKKILIVDDDQTLCDLYKELLSLKGFKVEKAYSGQEAISKSQKERPDVILLDIMMPVVSGLEVLKTLKEKPQTKKIKVIAFTALSDTLTKEKAQKLGVVDFLTKAETEVEEVVDKVKKFLS